MAYERKLTRREDEACEVYARFRLDGCTREQSLRYLALLGYEVTSNLATEIILNEKHIWGLK